MIATSSAEGRPQAPLTDADLDVMADILAAEWTPEQTMDLEEIDGLLAGMLCGPRLMMPSAILPAIFGDKDPVWPDMETAQRFIGLLMRRWNEIAGALAAPVERLDDPRAYVPLLIEWDEAAKSAQEALASGEIDRLPQYGELWAHGFMQAVRMTQDDWGDLPPDDDEGAQLVEEALADIAALVPDEDEEEPGPETSTDERDQMVADAILSVYDLHDYWKQIAFDRTRVKEPIRRAPKIGRNDPCPCGSGRKYKLCCGQGH
jgi:uncharacterized protein